MLTGALSSASFFACNFLEIDYIKFTLFLIVNPAELPGYRAGQLLPNLEVNMSHEIYRDESGRDHMAYIGTDVPWHGLGAQLDPDSDIETWKEAAGFNWNVVQAPIMYVYENPTTGERTPRK